MGMISDYAENKLVDFIFRGQAWTIPASLYIGLLTAAPGETGGGTEVAGGSYARVAVTRGLAQWAGTQSAGSTTASSGTSATTSNNTTITFPAPTANWGVVTHWGIYDAATGGNLLFYGSLAQAKTVNNGDAAPSFAAGQLSLQLDN